MSQVNIRIGPKSYTIACDPGEEAKVSRLGDLIEEQYAKLGASRAPTESQNLVFAALFMADELAEAREKVTDAKDLLSKAEKDLEQARSAADKANELAEARFEEEKAKVGGKKAELRAEIETLRTAEKRARDENTTLKAELEDARAQARHQHDMFANPEEDAPTTASMSDELALRLETLADRAERTATEMENGTLAGGTSAS